MASIEPYQTKNGTRYAVRYRKPDKTGAKKRGFKRKRDANEWMAKNVTTALSEGRFVDPSAGKATIGELADKWSQAHAGIWSKSYVHSIATAIDVHVKPKWEHRAVNSVRRSEVQEWVSDMASSKSPTVVLRNFGILKGVMQMASRDMIIAGRLPTEDIDLPHKPSRKEDRHYLTPEQLTRLAGNSQEHWLLVLDLGFCGPRWGEASALEPRYLDLDAPMFHIRRNIVRVNGRFEEGTPKSWEIRDTPMPAQLVGYHRDWIRERHIGDDDLLFSEEDGGYLTPQSVGKGHHGWWARALEKSGLEPMPVHDLRHTAASIAVSSGANVKALQRMLGHKSAAMTLDTYADLFDSDLMNVAAAINARIPAFAVPKNE